MSKRYNQSNLYKGHTFTIDELGLFKTASRVQVDRKCRKL